VKVIPRSARAEMAGEMADGTLNIRLKSAPEGGRANDELCGFLAGHFGVARQDVKIVTGATAQRKRVRISTQQSYGRG